ncbi:MAG: T9SS type A sorting domain-containing protein [Bacteroidota bacterium]|nr:T9SS type A sorting domain-containing protein [Bacteroidota bacterium]
MNVYLNRFILLLLAIIVFVIVGRTQKIEAKRAEDWMSLQQLLYKKSSASWSLSAREAKQLKGLRSLSSIVSCLDINSAYSCAGSTLPVAGLILKGQRTNADKVFLKWETQAEYNSKSFILERQSLQNTDVFDSVYYVTAAGISYSKSSYENVDLNNFKGSSFYRVKQIDRDGNYSFSNIVEVNGIEGDFSVKITPNPARATAIRFYFSVPAQSQTVDFTISNALGIPLIRKEKFVANSGYYQINSKAFQPGYYFITVHTPKAVYTKPFVIAD